MSAAVGGAMKKPELEGGEREKDEVENGGGGAGAGPSGENGISRKFSHASICSNEGPEDEGPEDDGEEGDEDDDIKSNSSRNIALGPQVPLKEQIEKDNDDESLRRWKEQLLGSVDLSAVGENPEPEVRVMSLTIISPGRTPLELPIPFVPNAKGYAFALKDGSQYHLKFTFQVSNNIVSGLKYTNTVWKTGMKVDNTKVMLGTFSPQLEPYTYELEEETTPSGMFARGSYAARTKFTDDDGKVYLEMNYNFEIRKDWVNA